jgi:hypothetical protein
MSHSNYPNETLRETLSALLDAEAGKTDALELRRLAKMVESDEQLLARYHRYTAVRAALTNEALGADSFLSGVRAAIDADQGSSIPSRQQAVSSGSWLRQFGQWALAASVAVAAVLVMPHNPPVSSVDTAASIETHSAKLGAVNNRLINPRVLSVGAGDIQSGESSSFMWESPPRECVIYRSGNLPEGFYPVSLPAGYRLCQPDSRRVQNELGYCQPSASLVACRY